MVEDLFLIRTCRVPFLPTMLPSDWSAIYDLLGTLHTRGTMQDWWNIPKVYDRLQQFNHTFTTFSKTKLARDVMIPCVRVNERAGKTQRCRRLSYKLKCAHPLMQTLTAHTV